MEVVVVCAGAAAFLVYSCHFIHVETFFPSSSAQDSEFCFLLPLGMEERSAL